MLITMLTAMYMMVRVIGMRFAQQQEPLPYMVSQPLPWQVHSVSHSRRSSKAEEFDGLRRNSIGVYRKLLKLRRPPLPFRPISGSFNRRNRRTAS
uniref:Secreted protein n=1 Tax=Amphiprion percula TaxID=161767 RepID=A0A3P8SWG7_AMPPE